MAEEWAGAPLALIGSRQPGEGEEGRLRLEAGKTGNEKVHYTNSYTLHTALSLQSDFTAVLDLQFHLQARKSLSVELCKSNCF